MTKLLRRLVLFVTLLFAVNALAAAINTVPIGQGAGFSAENVPIAVCTTGTASRYSAQNTFTCAPIPATPSPSASATPTTSATPTAVPDAYFAGQGIGNQGAFNAPFSNCPYGSAYSTSAHSMPCAPTLTPTPSATPTTTATATTTATLTPTPTTTPTALPAGILRGGAVTPTGAELSGDATTSGSNAVTVAKVNGNTPGNTCTNQFERAIDTSARGTCASIAAADLPAAPSVWGFGDPTSLGTTNGATSYFSQPLCFSATEANCSMTAPVSATALKMYCSVNTAPGASNTYTFTLMDNTVSTGITCATGNTQRCFDTSHSYAVTGGTSLLSVKVVTGVVGSAPTATVARCLVSVTIPF